MNRVTVSQTAQGARTHPPHSPLLHDPCNFVGLADTRGNCVSQGQAAIVGGLWAGSVSEGEGVVSHWVKTLQFWVPIWQPEVGCSCFPGREEMTMLEAQDDSGRAEDVSRRFGSLKVNLFDGNGEMAERQSIPKLLWFRGRCSSKGIGVFSNVSHPEFNILLSQKGTFSPAEDNTWKTTHSSGSYTQEKLVHQGEV